MWSGGTYLRGLCLALPAGVRAGKYPGFHKAGVNDPTLRLWTLITHLPFSEGQDAKMHQRSQIASGTLPATETDRPAGV